MRNNSERLGWGDPISKESKETIDTGPAVTKNANKEPETNYGIVVNAPFVNLREEPSAASSVINLIKSGTKVEILAAKNGYKKVHFDDQTSGWIHSKYIKKEEKHHD